MIRVNILVNNPGINPAFKSIKTVTGHGFYISFGPGMCFGQSLGVTGPPEHLGIKGVLLAFKFNPP